MPLRPSQHVLGALHLGLRACLGDLPRCGEHLVHEVAELDEVVVGLVDGLLPRRGCGGGASRRPRLLRSARRRAADSEAAGSISPSSSSCCSVG